MTLTLFSRDRNLGSLCREILKTLLGPDFHLRIEEDSPQFTRPSDVCIWDYDPEVGLPSEAAAGEGARHLVLVHSQDLASYQDHLPSARLQVLLKPVTRATLTAFLEQMVASQGNLPTVPAALEALETDRNELLQCLMQTNVKLQEYDQQRTNFLARAVHDFRAPLTSLCGYCDLLLGGELGPIAGRQKEVLQRMQHSARRLSRMAWALFELSVGPQVDRTVQVQRGDLRDCLDQALHELMPVIVREKAIDISCELLPSPEPLYFEKSQMEQVFMNILDNAGKFTPKGGVIRISGYPYFWERRQNRSHPVRSEVERRWRELRVPNAYRVDIRDSGPGIPAEHLSRIFEEYTRYNGAEDRSGGGLGLAICRIILSRHNGRVWADSAPTGAVFSFVLPFQPAGHTASEDLSFTDWSRESHSKG